jgi:hypothetical protein
MVSEQKKLCHYCRQKGQTSANASLDGPQSRMAKMTFLTPAFSQMKSSVLYQRFLLLFPKKLLQTNFSININTILSDKAVG